MIEVKKLCKINKDKTEVLKDVSFSLPSKGMYFLLGQKGSGKTSILNIIAGLEKASSGEVIIDNKSLNDLKSAELDYYRNLYIGFIFQDFNLFNNLNVLDNILLSNDLQNKSITEEKLNDLLLDLELNGLEKEKIKGLTDEQKCRVAIARALIKNPKIIIADFDEVVDVNIIKILKEISKERLVVIASRDKNAAFTYADGIIEINQGKLVNNNILVKEIVNENFALQKFKLPMLKALKFASFLFSKKIKLIFTILLLLISFVFLGLSQVFLNENYMHKHASAMVNSRQKYVKITKSAYNDVSGSWFDNGVDNPLTVEDISYMKENIESIYNFKYVLNENNTNIGLTIDLNKISAKDKKAYYFSSINQYNFIEADESFIAGDVLGQYPSNNTQIMIHSLLADYIIEYGVLTYNEKKGSKAEYFLPKSYEDLLNSSKYLDLSGRKVKISGIILDNTQKFDILKEVLASEIFAAENEKYFLGVPKYKYNFLEFEQRFVSTLTDVYVASGFINNLNLEKNITLDEPYYDAKVVIDDNTYFLTDVYSMLESKVSAFTGSKNEAFEKLYDNEIIVNEIFLDRVSNNNYSTLKEKFLKNKSGTENDFFKKYIKENNIVGKTITFTITNAVNEEVVKKDVKIIAVQKLKKDTIYLSDNLISNLMKENIVVNSFLVKESDVDALTSIFKKFPLENGKYISKTPFSFVINKIVSSINDLSILAFYASIVFGMLALLLLINYLVSLINDNKKEIKILRSLGLTRKDIFKIFFLHSLMVCLISFILAIFLIVIIIYFLNQFISNNLFFEISLLLVSITNILVLLLGLIILSFVPIFIASFKVQSI